MSDRKSEESESRKESPRKPQVEPRTLRSDESPKGKVAYTRGWEPGDPIPPQITIVDGVVYESESESESPELVEPQDIPVSTENNLRTPQNIPVQLQGDLHKMGDAVSSPNSSPNDKPWHERGDLVLAVVLALGAAVLGIVGYLLPPKSVSAVIFWLIIMFLLLASAEYLIARYRDWSLFRTIAGIIVMAVAVLAFGWFAWPEPTSDARLGKTETTQTEANVAPSPQPAKTTKPYYDLFKGRRVRDALFGMEEKKFPYQAVGDKNQVEILCRLDLPTHDRPTLSIYIPQTADVESATDAAVFAVKERDRIIGLLLAEVMKDETKALALRARPFKVQQLIIYHEIFIERGAVIGALPREFRGVYEFQGPRTKPPRNTYRPPR